MLTFLSSTERTFIRAHLHDDVQSLLLRAHPPGIDLKKLAVQIVARQKAREKLPTWYAGEELIFPPALSVEQASSESAAQYKASLVEGNRLYDLTGGMGVDTWAFAKRIGQVVYIERNAELAELAAHNLPLLGAVNVTVRSGNGLELIEEAGETVPGRMADWFYLDPHRRDERGGRVVRLDDCEPDLSNPETLQRLLNQTTSILIKASPLLDVDASVRQLAGLVEAVHVVAVQGEVKEVLLMIGQQKIVREEIQVHAVNLLATGPVRLQFRSGDEAAAAVTFGDPKQYVYEPNAAVLKAGAFRLVAERFGLTKLAPNSHLYTSDTLRTDFPGRAFVVQATIKPDAKALKQVLPSLKANLTVRNFPQSVADLRKKLNLREGGDVYLLATTLLNGEKRLLITQKANQAGSPGLVQP